MPKDNGSLRNATTSVVATAAKMAASIAHTATNIPTITTKQDERHHTQKPIAGRTGRFRCCAGGEHSTLQQLLNLEEASPYRPTLWTADGTCVLQQPKQYCPIGKHKNPGQQGEHPLGLKSDHGLSRQKRDLLAG